jgi:hypothetical protein
LALGQSRWLSKRIAGSGLAPITWPSGDTTVALVEACAGLGVVCGLLCQHGESIRTDDGQQNLQIRIHNQSNLLASPLRPE